MLHQLAHSKQTSPRAPALVPNSATTSNSDTHPGRPRKAQNKCIMTNMGAARVPDSQRKTQTLVHDWPTIARTERQSCLGLPPSLFSHDCGSNHISYNIWVVICPKHASRLWNCSEGSDFTILASRVQRRKTDAFVAVNYILSSQTQKTSPTKSMSPE